MSALLWALIALPLGAGAVLLVSGRRWNALAPGIGLAAAAGTFGLAVASALLRPEASAPLFAGVRAGLRVDGLSAVLVVAVAAVTTAVLVASPGGLGPRDNRGRFFGLMLLFAGAMTVTVTATTLPLLLMAWEVMGATSWALIGYWWRRPDRVRAADTAFLTTRAADLGLYLAAGAAVAGGVGSLDLTALTGAEGGWLHVACAGLVIAALGKSAQLPFSFWLSHAMRGPGPVSALLHSATMVAAGAYLLLRLRPLLVATGWAAPLVAWAGGVTALALGVVAVAQRDLKQLLAASTCSQVGFMVLAAGVGAPAGGTLQLLAHAAAKSALFLAAGAWLTSLGTEQLPALRGAVRRHPLMGAGFVAGALALAGLPPLSLWVAKDEVLAAVRAQSLGLYALGLAAAAVAAGYSVKALWYVTRPPPHDHGGGRRRGTRGLGRSVSTPVVVLAAAAVFLGAAALPGLSGPLRGVVGGDRGRTPAPWEMGLSAAVALAAAGAAWWWTTRSAHSTRTASPAQRWAAGWLCTERAARAVLVRPVLALARALAAFDDRAVDGAVRHLARGGLALARGAARADDRGVDGAVRAVAYGCRRLGAWARRPQTGLLHQYYAQAVVGFTLLLSIVLLVR
ncbi:proton-conducting transporter transmembrane domain-containing protein [Streptomyces reniochalinae]|uniref:proton-conducting transporter transmembrane domain-containing protein n=1 Tax=Streptomyces reniochalinae TaxID=2250578 RepID=UPI0015F0F183|nr:proton-conducting transporter membrane subunit [Streptomyces reniochalinae]